MRAAGEEPFPKFYTDSKKEGEVCYGDLPFVTHLLNHSLFLSHSPQRWEEVSQSQIKKVKKIWVREAYKQDKANQKLVCRDISLYLI